MARIGPDVQDSQWGPTGMTREGQKRACSQSILAVEYLYYLAPDLQRMLKPSWSFGKDQKLYVTVGQIERVKLFFLVGFLFKVRYKNIFSQFYRITTLAMGIFKK